jgi:hypothetical protein
MKILNKDTENQKDVDRYFEQRKLIRVPVKPETDERKEDENI